MTKSKQAVMDSDTETDSTEVSASTSPYKLCTVWEKSDLLIKKDDKIFLLNTIKDKQTPGHLGV